jgi:hypothetical protein
MGNVERKRRFLLAEHSMDTDIAAFLLTRGGHAWLGAKNATFCAIYIYNVSFHQDRLGTNTGKHSKKSAAFFLGHGWSGCSRVYEWTEALDGDYGEPLGRTRRKYCTAFAQICPRLSVFLSDETV